MNKLKNTLFLYLIIIISPFAIVSCQSKSNNKSNIKKKKEFVHFVVQPEVELGKSFDFSIHFEEMPDSISSSTPEIDGLELTDKLSYALNRTRESELTGDDDKVIKKFYSFYTYATPTKLGKIEFPILSVTHKGKVYKTSPFSINVVEKIKTDQNAVKVIWSSDQSSYDKKDTITLSLYEYSKFSKTYRKRAAAKNLSLKGKENEIKVGVEQTIDDIAGIDGFEKWIDPQFEIVNFDWDLFRNRQSMEKIDNELYIKTLILEIQLSAKTTGTVEFGPSEYDFLLYKSNTDYFNKFVPNDNGSYNVTDNGSTNLKVKSNKLTIEID
ncbi:hypothetical protein [Flavobacterium hercynium]|uniref:Lipoprotein n=1 Tax=Flavobacterium hercynium TaxID=387094 RepID=A0A226HJH2_9FLAO|nr:hypothetical protein [Flavobacterium hercynium]OXA93781.1 hypothetical protein B0A66_05900 [Flavobacterium hercynium]SMP20402.1 hypothetical protein SAMN06265346_106183 [Flavobacterium hercynium]